MSNMAFIAPVLECDQPLIRLLPLLLVYPLVKFVMSIEFIKNVIVLIWTALRRVWADIWVNVLVHHGRYHVKRVVAATLSIINV